MDIESGPLQLTCRHCGERFEAPQREPRLRCPHCRALGFPDRAGLYLIDLAWTCEVCGERNDGQHCFCVYCGTGLSTRCLRCEQPVTGAACIHCGTHQARAGAQRAVHQRREEWTPILREHASRPALAQAVVEEWQPIVVSSDEAAPLPGSLDAAAVIVPAAPSRQWRWLRRAGALAGAGGLLALTLRLTGAAWSAPWVARIEADAWLIRAELQSIDSTDPRYSMLLAGVVLLISFTPLILFVIFSIVRGLARGLQRVLA